MIFKYDQSSRMYHGPRLNQGPITYFFLDGYEVGYQIDGFTPVAISREWAPDHLAALRLGPKHEIRELF